MKVFVTGPDGLLGSNVVRTLIKRGYEVTAMVQPGRDPKTLQGLPIQLVAGDLTAPGDVTRLSAGHDYMIHVAAVTDMWPSKHPIHHKVNVEGTKQVMEAVRTNDIKRYVHVGSASSFGYGTKENPGNEESPYKSAKYGLDYTKTKLEAQELVVKAAREEGLPALVVCPTFMIGPYDAKPSSGAMVRAIALGQLPALSSGGKNWVAVKDVAVGVCNALSKGNIGESYILGGVNLSFKEAVAMIAEAIGQPKYPKMVMPNFIMLGIGGTSSMVAAITKKAPKLSYPLARIATHGHYFSPAKAIRELDLPQTPIGEAAQELHAWFKENGYL